MKRRTFLKTILAAAGLVSLPAIAKQPESRTIGQITWQEEQVIVEQTLEEIFSNCRIITGHEPMPHDQTINITSYYKATYRYVKSVDNNKHEAIVFVTGMYRTFTGELPESHRRLINSTLRLQGYRDEYLLT